MSKEQYIHRAIHIAADANKYTPLQMLEQRESQPAVYRYGKVALGNLMKPLVSGPFVFNGERYDYLTSGGEQIVYGTSDKVFKINYRLMGRDPGQIEESVRYLQEQSDVIANFLGDHWPTTIYTKVRFKGLHAVGVVQERAKVIQSFYNVEEMLAYEGGESYADELKDLLEAIESLHAATSLYPDIVGDNNIVLAKRGDRPTLQIVDNMPTTPDKMLDPIPAVSMTTGQVIASKLGLWHQAVASPIEWSESRELALH